MYGVVDDEGVTRYYGRYLGQVADNKDPRGLGRVRVTVPGFVEPSGWAIPVGGSHSSGAKGLGGFDVPPVGAGVVLEFHAGDVDVPMFSGGWKGDGEQVSVQPSDPAQVDKVKVYESDRFLIVLNGESGNEELLLKDKVAGDSFSMKPDGTISTATTMTVLNAPQVFVGGEEGAEPPPKGISLNTQLTDVTTAIGAWMTAVVGTLPAMDPLLATSDPTSPTVIALAVIASFQAALAETLALAAMVK